MFEFNMSAVVDDIVVGLMLWCGIQRGCWYSIEFEERIGVV
jgi:hypothetical protein